MIRRNNFLMGRYGAEVLTVVPLRFTRETLKRKITKLERRRIDWYSTIKHQYMIATDVDKVLENHKSVRRIGVHHSLHHLFRFNLARSVRNLRTEEEYRGLRDAIASGKMDPVYEYVGKLALKRANQVRQGRAVYDIEPLRDDLIQEGKKIYLGIIRRKLIKYPRKDAAATLAVISSAVRHSATELTKQSFGVRAGARELEPQGIYSRAA